MLEPTNLKTIVKKTAFHLPVLIIFLIALFTGILGVDFGYHWDEWPIIRTVTRSMEFGTPLPEEYTYPSMCYILVTLSILPDVLHNYLNTDRTRILKEFFPYTWGKSYLKASNITRLNLTDISKSLHFKLRTRIMFMFIAYLSILYIYVLLLNWRKNRIEALLASCLIGLSWEVAYHSRWVVSDAILMQFSALTMMCLFFALKNKKKTFWLVMAAITAGLGCSTKYPGGMLLIPVLVTAYYNSKENPIKMKILQFCKIILLFFIAYFIITLGTFLQPTLFIRDVWGAIHGYAFEGLLGNTVDPGITHFIKIITYFCMAVFSKYSAISCVFFILALVGAASLIINDRKNATIFLCMPSFYILFFSIQKEMFVRNLLILIPFFAVLAAIGCTFFYNKLKYPFFRKIFSFFILALLLINAGWLFYSSYSIKMKDKINYIKQLSNYIDQRPRTVFLLSQRVAADLLAFETKNHSNITLKYTDHVRAAVFYSSEVSDKEWSANQYNYTWTWFGPYEVNFNYYPTWAGDRRIVVMPVKQALNLNVF